MNGKNEVTLSRKQMLVFAINIVNGSVGAYGSYPADDGEGFTCRVGEPMVEALAEIGVHTTEKEIEALYEELNPDDED